MGTRNGDFDRQDAVSRRSGEGGGQVLIEQDPRGVLRNGGARPTDSGSGLK